MKRILTVFIIGVVFGSCQPSSDTNKQKEPLEKEKIDIQGHRGARGLLPENTIPAFKKALDLKVTTLELDVCVTGDGQLIISHEPWISPEICMDPEGQEIPKAENRKLNLFQMAYDQIKTFDCGSRVHDRFPEQQKLSVSKPLLRDMIQEVEAYGRQIGYTTFEYNIEIKSQPQGDNIYHPVPSVFSDMLLATLDSLIDLNRVTIQSFDFRVLQYLHESYPDQTLAALVENDSGWQKNIDELGFTPDIYSPYYKLLDASSVDQMHQQNMRIIPWTINTKAEMRALIDMGVDGIITDYPNIAVELNQ